MKRKRMTDNTHGRDHGAKELQQQSHNRSDNSGKNNNPGHHSFSQETYKPSIDFGPLKHVDWAASPLGEMRSWPRCLKALASLLVTLPYAAAIFWGNDLIMLHNTAWSTMNGTLAGQGKKASDLFGGEAIGRLRATMAGQVHDTDSANFFDSHGQHLQHLQTLLHPLCGEGKEIEGVMAQFISRSNNSLGGFWKKEQQAHGPDSHAEKEKGFGQNQGTTGTDLSDRTDSSQLIQDLPIDGRVLFQKFAHMIPTGLAILDSDAEALFVNDLFYKLTTHTGANPFRAWPQSIHPEDYDRVMSDYKNAFDSDRILSTQFRSAVPGEYDSPSWRLFMMRPISDEAPIAQDGYICAIIDITSLKAAELYQKRIASEAIERKKQQEKFMDMISHEIRNPLSAILHCSEGILESIKESPEGADSSDSVDTQGVRPMNHIVDQACFSDIVEAAETILFCVSHQKNIVDDILSFSKLDAMMLSLTPFPCQPDQKFAQYLRIFQPELREKSISIKFALDPSYPEAEVDWVNADMVRINQVLVNLMTNAIKFTARKVGERNITVSIGASYLRPTSYPPSVVFFEDEESANRMDATLKPDWGDGQTIYLLVAVRDTGIGISDKDQAKLFERFRQANTKTYEEYGGSGLGLFISRKLCQLHGGDIGVSSKEGEGSTFGFFFKVRRTQEPAQKEVEKREASIRNTSLIPENVPIDERTPESLVNPPTEARREVHPAISSDERYERSAKIAAEVDEKMDGQAKSDQRDQDKDDERRKRWEGGENRIGGELENPDKILSSSSQPSEEQSKPQISSSSDPQSDGRKQRRNDSASDQPQFQKTPGLGGDDVNPMEPQASKEDNSQSPGKEPKGDDPGAEVLQPRTTRPRHVLLVEDNVVNQRVLKRHLQTKGFRVTTANNGQEAVEAHQARLDEQGKKEDKEQDGSMEVTDTGQFECILMDQEMPVMDGNTAIQRIRATELKRWGDSRRNRIPCLGISANARDEQRDGMLQAGMDDVVAKPFHMADLVKRIHGMIDRGPMR